MTDDLNPGQHILLELHRTLPQPKFERIFEDLVTDMWNRLNPKLAFADLTPEVNERMAKRLACAIDFFAFCTEHKLLTKEDIIHTFAGKMDTIYSKLTESLKEEPAELQSAALDLISTYREIVLEAFASELYPRPSLAQSA
jgi:hypothetical protein